MIPTVLPSYFLPDRPTKTTNWQKYVYIAYTVLVCVCVLVGSSFPGTAGSSRKAFDTPHIGSLERISSSSPSGRRRGGEVDRPKFRRSRRAGWVRLSGGGGGVVVRSWTRTLALGGSSRLRVKRVRPRPSARLVLMSLTAGAWHAEPPRRGRDAPDKDRPVCWDVILHSDDDDDDDDVVLVSFARSSIEKNGEKERERDNDGEMRWMTSGPRPIYTITL